MKARLMLLAVNAAIIAALAGSWSDGNGW